MGNNGYEMAQNQPFFLKSSNFNKMLLNPNLNKDPRCEYETGPISEGVS
jgi:hypothetical protein